jgi:uncharacterized protein YkwD
VLGAVFVGVALAGSARAAVSYSEEEVAFVRLLNDYRVANGLKPLLVSDGISEACERHSSDMGKYAFFSHYTVKSDWFAAGASPWDRMAQSGYDYYTTEGENIAAGQSTAAQVFSAWKASTGHNRNMLNPEYAVIGVGMVQVPGSPYAYYWTTDFGGYVDPTAHAVGTLPAPSATRYQQNDDRLVYTGKWSTGYSTSASGGAWAYINSPASVTVKFTGTYLAWVTKKSPAYGKARVTLDSRTPVEVDLYSSAVRYQRKVWDTGTLAAGAHTVKIEWTGTRSPGATASNIGVDAFDVIGTLSQAPSVVAPLSTRYEQADRRFVYSGTWATFYTSGASGGSYKRASTNGASVTITFTGTYVGWIATKGTTLGKALVSLDGGPAQSVDLARSSVAYQQKVWDTGALAAGQHTVKIWRDPDNLAGKYISVDAVEVQGTLN